jgi:hypothetical protein
MLRFIKKLFKWGGLAPGEGGFIQAALTAAPYILQGLSALGGIWGKKKKYMDEQTLRALYGPGAVGKDTEELVNRIMSSPYGQQLLAGAAETGQSTQRELAARTAASGMGPGTGADSGASIFAAATAPQIQTGLERGVRADTTAAAMPIAADLVSGRMQAALMQQGQQNLDPSTMQRIGAAAGQTAASIPAPAPRAVPTVAAPAPAPNPLAINTMTQAPPVTPTFNVGRNAAPDEFSANPRSRMFGALMGGRASRSRSLVRSNNQ